MKKLLSALLAVTTVFSSAASITAGAETSLLQGDVNLSGDVSISDATCIQKYCASLLELSSDQLSVADMNNDGKITVSDATCIQKILAGVEEKPKEELTPEEIKAKGNAAMNDFSVALLKNSIADGENTLISPISVIYALAMTANGANGETLSEMEDTLGMPIDQLNSYCKAYPTYLNNPYSQFEQVSIANSIWYNSSENSSEISSDFLKTANDFYSADVYPTAFDNNTLDRINGWVNEKTHKMIPKILNNINPEALLYLINAVAFEADWQNQYTERAVTKGTFTEENGDTSEVELMHSEESIYLQDENAQGFIKMYEGGNYAFAALLPDEGVKLSDYVQSLSGERLTKILNEQKYMYHNVYARLPKFEVEYSDELSDNLTLMGMPDAFDSGKADFTNMIANPLDESPYISSVIHKTYISVTELGTRAGAATAIDMPGSAAPSDEEPKRVYLDRPFVYMLINTQTNTPLFIGTVENIK